MFITSISFSCCSFIFSSRFCRVFIRLSTRPSISVKDSNGIARPLLSDKRGVKVCVLDCTGAPDKEPGRDFGVIDFCGETRFAATGFASFIELDFEDSNGGVGSRPDFKGEMLVGAGGGLEKDEFLGVIERVGVWVGDLFG